MSVNPEWRALLSAMTSWKRRSSASAIAPTATGRSAIRKARAEMARDHHRATRYQVHSAIHFA